MTFGEFISLHEGDDPVRLLLSRGRYPEMDMDLVASTLQVRARLRTKVPEWYGVPSLKFPSRLSGEQCSSAETARYKATVAQAVLAQGLGTASAALRPLPSQAMGPSLLHGRGWPWVPKPCTGTGRIADLTGGLGVDSWAFSEVAEEVLYNEMQTPLMEAVRDNFRELGVENVVFRSREVAPGSVAEVLGGFSPDLIYLDPARRSPDGRKVFRLEDCSPEILPLLPELFCFSRYILLKLSPMADLTLLKRQIPAVRDIHVVAAEGECKELLFLLERDAVGEPRLIVRDGGAVLEIPAEEQALRLAGRSEVGGCLFEPGKALAKAGAFALPCRYGLKKLGVNTHLYSAPEPVEALRPFGKWFALEEVCHLDKRTLRDLGRRYPQAEVTARNISLSSEELRRRIGCGSGGGVHLFGARLDDGPEQLVLVLRRL